MINGRMVKTVRAKLVCGAVALIIASSAHAATLVGGGTFTPAIGYVGGNALAYQQLYGTSGSNSIAAGSLFGVFSAQPNNSAVSYCQTSEDVGKNIFAGMTVGSTKYNVQNICEGIPIGAGNSSGFSATAVGRTDLTQPNFAAVDSPFNASEYINYINNHPSGDYPVQFPAVAGAIAIAFNVKDSTGAQVTSSEVNFTDQQLCEIFSGEITNWSDPNLAGSFTLPAGHFLPSAAINVQYRSDSSGTTFGLSNHLAYVCGAIKKTYFETSQSFSSMVANFFSANGVETLPSNWTGSNGELRLAVTVGDTANSLAYMETANALNYEPSLPIADVNGTSPTANFGNPITLTSSALAYNLVINTTNNTTGNATLEAISAIPGVTNPPTTQCIALVKPAIISRPGLPGGIPEGTYPIMAVSYLLGNTAGNGTDLTNTRGLLTAPYAPGITSKVTTIGLGTGLAFLTLGTNTFTPSQVSGCLVN